MAQAHSRLAPVDILPARSAGAICLHLALGKQGIIRIWQAIGIHGLADFAKAAFIWLRRLNQKYPMRKSYWRVSSTAAFGSST